MGRIPNGKLLDRYVGIGERYHSEALQPIRTTPPPVALPEKKS